MQELVKNVIYSFSGIGVGFMLYLALFINLPRAVKTHGWRRQLNVGYILERTCVAGVLALLSTLVYQSGRPVTLNWQSITYTVLVIGVALGYVGVAIAGWKLRNDPKFDEDVP